jgi:biotin carboxyl carrier protein
MGAPFAGVVSEIFKEEEAQVSQGDVILAISAMKMIINLSAPSSGVLRHLDAAVGDSVDKGDMLFEVV